MNILNRIVIVQECDATEAEKNYYSRGHKKYFYHSWFSSFTGLLCLSPPLRRRCPRVAEALAEAQALAQALGDRGSLDHFCLPFPTSYIQP